MSKKRPPPPHGGKIDDRRAEFERITRRSPRDSQAERAFVESKMRIVRTDPKLSDEEKQRALADLAKKLRPTPR
jgi:hypothetical protein